MEGKISVAGGQCIIRHLHLTAYYTEWSKSEKWKWESLSCICDSMDYTVHELHQARILECVAFPFSMGSSQPRDQTQVSRIAGGFFTSWATREAQEYWSG